MKVWTIIFRVIIGIIAVAVIAFNVLLYTYCKQQRTELNSVRDKQDVEAEFNSNKFKFQQEEIERISKDLEMAQQQIKDHNDALAAQKDDLGAQKDALLQETEKREQMENESKSIQKSLVGIMAETDAIKDNMKGWQKDYVSVLAALEKKMDDSQYEMKAFENNLVALNIPELKRNINSIKSDIEKLSHPADNSLSNTGTTPEKKIEHIGISDQ